MNSIDKWHVVLKATNQAGPGRPSRTKRGWPAARLDHLPHPPALFCITCLVMDPSASEAIFDHSVAPSPTPGQTGSDSTAATASPSSSDSASTTVPSSTTASSTQPPAAQKKEGVSLAGLETEVTQVLGSLRSFWGGVSKQVGPRPSRSPDEAHLIALVAAQHATDADPHIG
jgi:hypothetical protein